MKIEQLKNILLRITRIGLMLALFSPIVFGAFGLNPSEYPQAVFFRSIIELICASYVFLALLDKKYLPKLSPILICILIFDAILIVSSISGVNFYASFFGSMQRGEGIIMHLHLLAFFVILTSVIKEKEDWLDLLRLSLIVSTISSFTAVLQQFGIRQFMNINPPRISGTMTNPDIFAAYTSLSIFVGVLAFLAERKFKLKIAWLSMIALDCYALIFSATRGSILGAGVAAIFLIFPLFFKLTYKKRLAILFVILALCIGLLTFYAYPNLSKKIPGGFILSRFTEFNLNGRENIWQSFWPAFSARPFLGWGNESFIYISDIYMKNGMISNYYHDRPHNKFIEVPLYTGIIGFLAYLSVFAVIFLHIFKNPDNENFDGKKVSCKTAISAFIVCYVIQNIFLFDTTATYILFFLVAGLVNNNFDPQIIRETKKNSGHISQKLAGGSLFCLLMAATIYQINIKPTLAAMNFPNSHEYAVLKPDKALANYEKAISMLTFYDYDLKMAFINNTLILEDKLNGQLRQKALDKLLKMESFLLQNIKNRNSIVESYQYLIQINEQKYILDGKQSDLDEMESNIKNASAINPNLSITRELYGELEILKGNDKIGEDYIKQSCIIDKCYDYEIYQRLGTIYMKKGDLANIIKNFQKVFDIYYDHAINQGEYLAPPESIGYLVNYIGTAYCHELNDIKSCKKIFEQGEEILPKYSDILKQRLAELIQK